MSNELIYAITLLVICLAFLLFVIQLTYNMVLHRRLEKRLEEQVEGARGTETVEDVKQLLMAKKKGGRKIPLKMLFMLFSLIMIGSAFYAYSSGASGLFKTLLIVYAVVAIIYMIIRKQQRKKREEFVNVFPQVIEFIGQATAGGKTMPEAMMLTAEKYTGAVGQVFGNISKSIQVGRSYVDAVRREAYRLDIPEFYYFSIMLITQFKTGGKVINLLNSLAGTLYASRALKLKIKALAAQSKSSMWIMALLPWAAIGALTAISWDFVSVLYTTTTGNYFLVGCLVAEAFALLLCKRLMRINA